MIDEAPPPGLAVAERRLENAILRVEIADDGTLASVFDKRAGREVLAGRGNQLWAYVDKPRNWDAWDIEEGYERQGEEIAACGHRDRRARPASRRDPHHPPLSRQQPSPRRCGSGRTRPRLDFLTEIDWHERRILLKARFPLAVRSDSATFECAHGVIRRPTHRNTSWDTARFEVAAHRFADLSEPGYGVALLNDGKYGHHARGNELGLSLLRSPVYPDPLADEGRQSFTYALCPHAGDWLTGGVLAEAEDLNRPLLCRPVAAAGEASWTAVRLDGLALGLSALQARRGRQGADPARSTSRPAPAAASRSTLPDGWRLGERGRTCSRTASARPSRGFLPFQLHSWTVEKA